MSRSAPRFTVAATVVTPSYVASGVQVEPTLIPLGVTLLDVQTQRWDGVSMSFLGATDALTLGNVVSGVPRCRVLELHGGHDRSRRPSRYERGRRMGARSP